MRSVEQLTSYAQNGEDIVLARLFKDQAYGRYIDVGAGHPELDSVTKLFYDRGWRGINVEPSPEPFALLQAERPDDVNLAMAVADFRGTANLFLGSEAQAGLGTLDELVAQRSLGEQAVATEVPVTTLADICVDHVPGPIDFLKIDVEGLETAVIRGADWAQFRPRVVVVEATAPNSTIPTHGEWEPMLIAVDYVLVLFEGLNRFYVPSDDLEARTALSVPANIQDGFVRNDLRLARRRVVQLERENESLRKQLDRSVRVAPALTTPEEPPPWQPRAWDEDNDPYFDIPETKRR